MMKSCFHKIVYSKFIYTVMAFAFFWLVIGDLITLHQKLIYGFDPFGQHQPFAKPGHNSNKNGKNQKVLKIKDTLHFHFFEGITNDTGLKPFSTTIIFGDILIIHQLSSANSPVSLRAPPAV